MYFARALHNSACVAGGSGMCRLHAYYTTVRVTVGRRKCRLHATVCALPAEVACTHYITGRVEVTCADCMCIMQHSVFVAEGSRACRLHAHYTTVHVLPAEIACRNRKCTQSGKMKAGRKEIWALSVEFGFGSK